jgi:hypothetical protein
MWIVANAKMSQDVIQHSKTNRFQIALCVVSWDCQLALGLLHSFRSRIEKAVLLGISFTRAKNYSVADKA